MKKIKIAFVLMGSAILILSAFIIFTLVTEFSPNTKRPPNFEKIISRMKSDLDLTDEQIAKFRALHEPFNLKLEENKKKIEDKRDILFSLTSASEFDEKGISKVLEEIDSIERDNKINFMKLRFEGEKILTEEQRQIFRKKMCRLPRFRNRGSEHHDGK